MDNIGKDTPSQVLAELRKSTDGAMHRELPGEVLWQLRESTGRSRRNFGELVGWSYSTQFRLETGRLPFRRHHLDALIFAECIEAGSEWTLKFEKAIAYQAGLRPPPLW